MATRVPPYPSGQLSLVYFYLKPSQNRLPASVWILLSLPDQKARPLIQALSLYRMHLILVLIIFIEEFTLSISNLAALFQQLSRQAILILFNLDQALSLKILINPITRFTFVDSSAASIVRAFQVFMYFILKLLNLLSLFFLLPNVFQLESFHILSHFMATSVADPRFYPPPQHPLSQFSTLSLSLILTADLAREQNTIISKCFHFQSMQSTVLAMKRYTCIFQSP